MSATIQVNKLKFSVFGRGYDEVRNDSGRGGDEDIVLNMRIRYATFNSSGEYLWVDNGGTLKKYRTSDWTEVSTSPVPTSTDFLFHPNNTDNDIGVTKSSGNLYIFDLTTNEVITSGANSLSTNNDVDCVIDDDVIRIGTRRGQNSNYIYNIDMNDLSVQTITFSRDLCGFVDSKSMWGVYAPPWFSDAGHVSLVNASNSSYDWDVTSQATGSDAFPNIGYSAFTSNGKVYVPSYINLKWHIGEYNGMVASDYETPLPNKKFAAFDSKIVLKNTQNGQCYPIYSNEKKSASVQTNMGLYMTDFKEMYLLDDASQDLWIPKAMTNSMVLTTKINTSYSKVFHL